MGRAETRLAERNAQLELAGKIARIGSYTYDDPTQKLQVSLGCAAIYGLPEGTLEISREDWRALVHPDDLRRLDAVTRRALANRETELVLEYRILRHGEVRWIESRALILYNEVGRALRRIGAEVDVTERKRAEDTLHQRETELVEAQRLARIGSWHWDAESDVTVGSDELLRIFGCDPATQRVPTYRDQRGRWYPVDDWKRLKAAMQSTMQTGIGYEVELQAFRNEIPIWITARGAAVRNSTGQTVGLRGTVQDITGRKSAERMLAERNLQLRLAAKTGLVGSYTSDIHTEIVQISPGYAAIYGLPEGTTEITRSEWLTRVHPEDVERLQQLRSEALRERREEYNVDYRIFRRDGEVRWIESRVFILYGSDTTAHRQNGVNIDVTERKRAEALINDGKTRMAGALAAGQVIAFEWDALTGVSLRSDNAADILGFDHDGLPFLSHVHLDDRTKLKTHIRELRPRSPSYALTFRYIRPDGGQVWLEETARGEFDATGKLVRIKGLTRDITERKQAELALAERNTQLALAAKVGLVATFAYDVKTERMQISDGYAAIYGFTEGTTEIARSQWRALVLPEDLERLETFRSQAFANRQREYSLEYRIVLPDRGLRWIETRGFNLYDGEGRPERVIGVNIDVTERKRAEEARKILNAELDHRVKNALATVTAVISHTQQGSRSVADFAAALEGRIRSMAATHELLSSRHWQELSLIELIRRELAPYAASKNTEISGPTVLLKPEAGQALAMVLHELATNAAKYGALSTNKGRVLIRWDRPLNGRPLSSLVLEWREIGGPRVDAPGKSSYGASTIHDLIPYEFGGTVDLVFAPEGVRCRLELPGDWLTNMGETTVTVEDTTR